MNKVTSLKVDIFDILREQQALQYQMNALETRKTEKLKELAELEATETPAVAPTPTTPVENFDEEDGQNNSVKPPKRPFMAR